MSRSDGLDPAAIHTRDEFARQLSMLRERAGLSTRELARITATPLATLGGYLSGRHLPHAGSRDVLLRVLGACGIEDDDARTAWVDAAARARRNGQT